MLLRPGEKFPAIRAHDGHANTGHDIPAHPPRRRRKGVFTVSAEIPEKYNIPLNRDGSRPKASLDVTAPTYGTARAVLSKLNEQADEVGFQWLFDVLSEDEKSAVNTLPEDSDLPGFAREAFAREGEEFLTFTTDVESTVTATYQDDTQETEGTETTTITITAPSVAIGMKAFGTLTGSRYLQSLAISFCPETTDDEYGDSREVLVVG